MRVPKHVDRIAADFLHHLHDTLILLGADPRFAVLAKNPEVVTEADVHELRCYNIGLIDGLKSRLVGINTTTVTVVKPPTDHPGGGPPAAAR